MGGSRRYLSVGWASPCLLAAVAAMPSGGCRAPVEVDLVVRDVAVVDVDTGQVAAGSTVVVDGGRIVDVRPSGGASGYRATVAVDGAGRFLMPALADAHVHIQGPSELDGYLLHGVGLVVNMSGRPSHLELARAVAEGRLAGPTIVTAGPTLDGAEPTNPLFDRVTVERAAAIVDWIAERGYDLVKVYQQIGAAELAAVVAAAEARGLVTSGHVSRETGISGALEAGLGYVAHGEELAFESFDEASRRFDRDDVPRIVALVAEHDVTVTPMISYLENAAPQALALDDYLAGESMARIPAAMLVSFGPRQGWFSNRDEPREFADQMTDAAGFVADLTAAMDAAGVALILGTDAGFGGAVPGASVHQELASLVRAGLSELAALQTATRNVGRYLRRIDPERPPWGRIQPGYVADLLLLRANPLGDIEATRGIDGVALAGRWHGPAELAAIDRRLRDRQAALIAPARAFETALVAGDAAAAGRIVGALPPELAGASLINPDSCIFLGYRHYYGGRRQLAGELYEICAAMHPDMAPLWLHIGRVREERGDAAGAAEAYQRSLDLDPWFGDAAGAMARLRGTSAAAVDEPG